MMEDLHRREGMLRVVRELRADLDQVIARVDSEQIEEPGNFEAWSFKDMIAHLTGWRIMTAARLESAMDGSEPRPPWPDELDEDEDLHEINDWIYRTNRDKPLAQVIRKSNETFDRLEHALATMTEEDLFETNRFEWVTWTDEGVGPAVIRGTWNHYHVEHEPEILAWLEQQ